MVDESRRNFLKTAATAIGTGIAGCSGIKSSNNEEAAPTETGTPLDVLTIEDVRQPDQLPRIWKNSLNPEDYHAHAEVGLNNPSELTANINGETVNNYGKLEPGNHQISLQPRWLQPGENTLELTAQHDTETATVTKQIPELKKLDIIPGVNQELREQIQEHLGEEAENYLEQHSVPEDHTVFTSYQTPEEFNYADYSVDLAALEWWHDNDFNNLSVDIRNPEMRKFLESINLEDDLYPEVENKEYEKARNRPSGWVYPNSEGESNTWGHFDFEQFSSASSAQEAMDWLHPYLFGFEDQYTADVISTEDEKFAAVIQEALDQYTELHTHVWAFDIPESLGSTHGNGLTYDQTNNELMIMETVTNPETTETEEGKITDPQLHPLIENSNYLNPEHEDYSHWWHPLRFDGTEPDIARLNFQEGKAFAASLLRGIATGYQDSKEILDNRGPAITTEYVTDRIEKLRNYKDNDFDFNQLKQESKIFNQFIANKGENGVIYLDKNDNFQIASGINVETYESIWDDQEGEYDDIDRLLEENPGKLAA